MAKQTRTLIHQAKRNKYANPAQEEKLAKLKKKYPNLKVVPHRETGRYRFHVLIELERRGGYRISPIGRLWRAKPPNPQCMGSPTMADCVNNGYCTRSLACND